MREHRSIILTAVFVLAGALIWYRDFPEQPWTLLRVAGLVLAIPAFVLWVTARIQLGRSFAVRAEAKELVTHGLYSKIRNPIYVFGALFITGFLLLINKPLWLLVLAAIIPLQIYRAKVEAKVLEAKFGDAYRAYRSKTWF
jgi:protein-S-isoprenylcysteine O-methyltransferase Ste14